jgi:hypothetical protein
LTRWAAKKSSNWRCIAASASPELPLATAAHASRGCSSSRRGGAGHYRWSRRRQDHHCQPRSHGRGLPFMAPDSAGPAGKASSSSIGARARSSVTKRMSGSGQVSPALARPLPVEPRLMDGAVCRRGRRSGTAAGGGIGW